MRLAIADPPYLGRGDRWYGDGRGHYTQQRNSDHHPAAAVWDDPAQHVALIERLVADYDGWAAAGAPDSLALYLGAAPSDIRTMVWHRGNSIPSGARVAGQWEFVLVHIPESRRGHGSGLGVSDVLHRGVDNRSGFTGSKPAEWTRWVLAALGYDPSADTLDDLFPGSGRVERAAAVLA
jgi:hypothetical protein